MNTIIKTTAYLTACLVLHVNVAFSRDQQASDTISFEDAGIGSAEIPVNFKNLPAERITGSVFRVSGEELRKNPTNDLMQALSGRIPGFYSIQGSNAPGSVTYENRLRGDAPVILLDGIPRDIVIDLQEIEEVIFYKDFSAAAMYGDMGANGIINIITKKGRPDTRIFEAEYQYGINTPISLPDYPDAYESALLYNRARQNDGLPPVFDDHALESFQNGTDPFRYPDVDYYGEFLRKNTPLHNLTATFLGGDSTIQYYLHGGWQSNQGLENIGEQINYNRILLRSDLGIRLSDIIRLDLGITGWMDISRYASLGKEEMFGIMSSYPAYALPMQLGDSAFIVNRDYTENLLSKLTAEGFSSSQKRTVNFNSGITFDLDEFVKGLTMKHYVSLDLYNELIEGTEGNPSLYEPEYLLGASGEDSLVLNVYKYETKDLDIGHMSDDIYRHYTYYASLNYAREFGDNQFLNADLLYFQNAVERRGKTGDIKNQMINGNISYSFRNKYLVDGYLMYTGTQKLVGENKFHLSPGMGLAWVASGEPFLKNLGFISFLKLRASFGEVGLVNTSDYYVYRDTWYSWDEVQFGTKDKNSDYDTYILERTGNPDAEWPVLKKFNAGLDAFFNNNSLGLVLDIYHHTYSGQLERLFDSRSGMEGNYRFIPFENYNETMRWGIESGISYNNTISELSYAIGVNFTYSKEKYSRIAELNYPDEYRMREGQPSDAIWGLESDGLFRDANDIANSATQMFGVVNPGDIKYKDQNGDQIIDEKDYVIVGNTVPDYCMGIYLSLGYKNFSLFVQGAGIFGHTLMLDNPYYWNYGLDKYSVIMQDEYPRLTSLGSSNNYRSSDYWIADGGFFRLKTVELSYRLPSAISNRIRTGVTFFIRGNNLLTISGMKDLDPENLDAGVTGYPLYRTYSMGISISL